MIISPPSASTPLWQPLPDGPITVPAGSTNVPVSDTSGHASNLPFSDRGTGATFSPATRFTHSSNEPVQPLNSTITLDKPLSGNHAINAPVADAAVTNAGYQGPSAPDQWFGGPTLSASADNMVLRDAHGLVVDSLNYGSLVDPWVAEGYQGNSGTGQSGCFAHAPGTGRSDSADERALAEAVNRPRPFLIFRRGCPGRLKS